MSESSITKRAIVKSMKELTAEKSFDKISISDISNKCHINRQTFYYHFNDKYSLLKWIYYTDLFLPNIDGITLDNWDDKFCGMLTAMENDKFFYTNTIVHAEDYIKTYFIENMEHVFFMAIDKVDINHHMSDTSRMIFTRFFAYGLCGIITDWAKNNMPESATSLASSMRKLLESSLSAAYEYAAK